MRNPQPLYSRTLVGVTARREVRAVAPVRVCDNGGWTDTWFAGHGAVCNLAVRPGVEVQIEVHDRAERAEQITLDVPSFRDRYGFDPAGPPPGRHPLLEATVAEIGVPGDVAVVISISSAMPPGCATGTSAAVTVALVGALDALTPGRLTPAAVARLAHRVEAERLGWQSGIQDQLCSAFGGICFIEMARYPEATVTQLRVPDAVWGALDRRLVLVFLGRPHASSAMHRRVIADLEREGPCAPRLEPLRRQAGAARDAILAGDLEALGTAMAANTAAQAALHPDLVSTDAAALIDLARSFGAVGWKVNGAGGDGGSLTLLAGAEPDARARLVAAVAGAPGPARVIPTRLSRSGLHVSHTPRPPISST